MGKAFVELQHIVKSLDGQIVLSDINLSMDAGKVYGLVGDNGAGKSVLVKLLSGIYPPDSGKMFFQGEPCSFTNPHEARGRGIVTIFQECNLIPELTVAENLCIGKWYYKGRYLKRIDWHTIKQNAKRLLDELNCNISPNTLVKDLNYAQQRLVEIAKAFSQNARFLIFDEAYESLTPAEMRSISCGIQRLCNQGVSVLYISQRIEDMLSMCDSIAVLQDGKIVSTKSCVQENAKNELLADLSAVYLHRKFPRIYLDPGRVILQAENLSTDRGLQNVSFQLRKGEVLGIAGRLGSGRTALARALFGIDQLNSGQICINGTNVRFSSPVDAVKSHIGYIPDSGHTESIFQNLDIAGNITISNLREIYTRIMLNLPAEKRISEKFQRKLFIHASDGSRNVHMLSSGNRQKVLFSKWIFTNSRILVMDEPAKGIDKSGKIEIYNIINKLVMDGNSVILISSDFHELMGMSDRILVINDGKITQELSRSMFSASGLMKAISETS